MSLTGSLEFHVQVSISQSKTRMGISCSSENNMYPKKFEWGLIIRFKDLEGCICILVYTFNRYQ
eukprot:Gb_00372 [translate_table: standard]